MNGEPTETPEQTLERFNRALESVVKALQRDRTILGAVLCGSLAYDTVWEKSDIDLLVIADESHREAALSLTEDDITIHASVMPRSAFKRAIEGGLQSSFFHSLFSKSRLLFAKDESLPALYENSQKIGARDRSIQLARVAGSLAWSLPKAEKWFYVKRDMRYSFVYLMYCVEALAKIEMVSRGIVTGREVIHQALAVHPEFFARVYTDLIDGPKDEPAIASALADVNGYLEARIPVVFECVFAYLYEAGGPRTAREIDQDLAKSLGHASHICEFLADRGWLSRIGLPRRIHEKSSATVNEAAFYYDGAAPM
jgi:hypothetical protein